MFIDEATITIGGGKGGSGAVAFYPKKRGPCGGNGGWGGNVYLAVNHNLSNLNQFLKKNKFVADEGRPGEPFTRSGANGQNLTILLPNSTTVIDQESRKEIVLTTENSPLLVCRGGRGGLGNEAFKSPTNQTPKRAEPGRKGETCRIKLVIKLIADFGLIGLPNAGKSSLLNELTQAGVKVAAYPFTTLEPNLGVFRGKVLADIPGLIEGASRGKGLGIKFLKHIEKVKLLLHCLSVESDNLVCDYETVIKELSQYSGALLEKKQVILLTKIDLITPEQLKVKVRELAKFKHLVIPVSIHDWDSLEKLKSILR